MSHLSDTKHVHWPTAAPRPKTKRRGRGRGADLITCGPGSLPGPNPSARSVSVTAVVPGVVPGRLLPPALGQSLSGCSCFSLRGATRNDGRSLSGAGADPGVVMSTRKKMLTCCGACRPARCSRHRREGAGGGWRCAGPRSGPSGGGAFSSVARMTRSRRRMRAGGSGSARRMGEKPAARCRSKPGMH